MSENGQTLEQQTEGRSPLLARATYLRQGNTIVVTIGLAILIGMLLGPFGFYFPRLPYRK